MTISTVRISRPLLVSVALVIICTEAALKGWFVFFTLPSLLVTVPVIVILQTLTVIQLKRQAAHPLVNRVVHAQLIGVVLCYVCLAGFSDTAAWWVVPSMIINETFADVINSILLFFLAPVCIGLTLAAILLLSKGAHAKP